MSTFSGAKLGHKTRL